MVRIIPSKYLLPKYNYEIVLILPSVRCHAYDHGILHGERSTVAGRKIGFKGCAYQAAVRDNINWWQLGPRRMLLGKP